MSRVGIDPGDGKDMVAVDCVQKARDPPN